MRLVWLSINAQDQKYGKAQRTGQDARAIKVVPQASNHSQTFIPSSYISFNINNEPLCVHLILAGRTAKTDDVAAPRRSSCVPR